MPPQGDVDTLTSPLPKVADIPPKPVTKQAELKPTAPSESVVKPSGFKFTPVNFDKIATSEDEGSDSTPPKTAVNPPAGTASSSVEVANISSLSEEAQKKLERAKRFGIPLTEDIKKTVRAAKFGIPEEQTAGKGHNGISCTLYAVCKGFMSIIISSCLVLCTA